MSKFNKFIKAWLTNEAKEKLVRYAFSHEKTQEKAIEGLFRRVILKHRYTHPIAHIYINNKLTYSYIQAVPIHNNNIKWYGPEISEFKIKITRADGTKSHAYYSNSLVPKQQQFEMLIEQHCSLSDNFYMAIIMDKNDKIIANVFKKDNQVQVINF